MNEEQKIVLRQESLHTIKHIYYSIQEFVSWLTHINSDRLKYLDYADEELNEAFQHLEKAKKILEGVV